GATRQYRSEGITKRQSCGVGVEAPRIRRAKECVLLRILVVVPASDSRPLRGNLEPHVGKGAVEGRPQAAKRLQRIQGRCISVHAHDAVAHVGGEPLNGLQQETGRSEVISIAVGLIGIERGPAFGVGGTREGIPRYGNSGILEADEGIRTYVVVVVSKLHSEPFVAIGSRCETEVPGVSVVANLLDSVSCLVDIACSRESDPADGLIAGPCPILLQPARADAGQEVVRR